MVSTARRFSPNYSVGFTFFETLIVVAVAVLLVGAGLASYTKFNRSQRAHQAILNLATELRVVQKKADIGENNCGGLEFKGYRLKWTLNSNTASVYQVCDTSELNEVFVTLINGFKFNNFDQFDFLPLSQGFSDNKTIEIVDDNGQIKTVEVLGGGVISVSD